MSNNQDNVKFIIAKRIREHADKWDWKKLSENKAITMDIIKATHDLPWDQILMTRNPNITWDFIINHIEYGNWKKSDWCWESISKKHVTMDIVKSRPDLPWDYEALSDNISINIDDVLENIEQPWDWWALSINTNMTWDIIQAHKTLPWREQSLSANPSITWDIIKDNHNVDWNHDNFIRNPHFTLEIVNNNPSIFREFLYMNRVYNIEDTPNYDRHGWSEISSNVTWDIVKDNPNKPWNYYYLSQNVTWDVVLNNLDKPWYYPQLSYNANITWDIVEGSQGSQDRHIAWNWHSLSANPSVFRLTTDDIKMLSKLVPNVRCIQARWRDAFYNPRYKICRQRIMKEFNELGSI